MPNLVDRYRARTELNETDIREIVANWQIPHNEIRESITTEHLLIISKAYLAIVLEDVVRDSIAGVILAVFITEPFHQCLRASKEPWVMRHALEWETAGRKALLSKSDVGAANANEGISLLLTSFGIWPEKPTERGAVYARMVEAFVEEHSGYNLRRIVTEPANRLYYDHLKGQGYRLINPYSEFHARQGTEGDPALFGVETADALEGHDFLLVRLFDYETPRCQLSHGERELLIEACRGTRDADIADRLSISAHALKQRWASIYRKLESAYPGVLSERGETKRGAEKRQPTIEFMRNHKQELRDYTPSKKSPSSPS